MPKAQATITIIYSVVISNVAMAEVYIGTGQKIMEYKKDFHIWKVITVDSLIAQ